MLKSVADAKGGRLARFLKPASIAVVGGGAWGANVIAQCRQTGFDGPIWPVHPKKSEVAGEAAFASVADLPGVPDAVFVGVNRYATVDVMRDLSALGAGGAVCFASGFAEAQAELDDGAELQAALMAAAGDMPFLGPNCYGFINALDGAALWPDQHGALRCDSGVAILTQSSNIALNMTMQMRGLPIAYIGTLGNQAQIDLAVLGQAVLEDPRVTALGLHIEGISDIRAFEALAARAAELGKRVVAVKVGASDQAHAATVSHTASLAGSDAGARALLQRLGIAQVGSLAAMLETLKILHTVGPLASNQVASMSCSGGEASLMADTALGYDVDYPALSAEQKTALREALGPKVALANPLDYHTYIWADRVALTACFSGMMQGSDLALGMVVLDFPRGDRCSAAEWDYVIEAVDETAKTTGRPMAVLASLTETLPEAVARDLIDRGVVPLCGMSESLEAVAAAAWLGRTQPGTPVLLPEAGDRELAALSEGEAKAALAQHGLRVPGAKRVSTAQGAVEAAREIGFPVVLKGEGFAHKTEAGAVRLGLNSADEVQEAAEAMGAKGYLVEEMVPDAVAELLIGVLRDPVHGFVLTLGAGGVMTEILQDTQSLLLPVSDADISAALDSLRIGPLLAGYRGAAGADRARIIAAVQSVADFVAVHVDVLAEVEINPLLCLEKDAVAVDALIRWEENDG